MFPSDPTADCALFHYFSDGENRIRRENRRSVWHLIMKVLNFILSRRGQMSITAAHYHYTPIFSPILYIHVDNSEDLETHVTDGSGWQWTKIWPCDDEYGPGDDLSDDQMYTYSVLWQVLEKFNKDAKPIDIGVGWVSIEVDTHDEDDTTELIELLDSEWRIVEVRITERRSKILQFVWRGLDQYHGYHQRLPIHV